MTRRTASFKGVSFKYDPQIFGEVMPEEVAEQRSENETDKPNDVHPRHVRFTFRRRDRERDKLLTQAQKRYLRAGESLAKVRKLLAEAELREQQARNKRSKSAAIANRLLKD